MDSVELTFGPSQRKDCVSIMLKSDNILEETEKFLLLLSSQGDQPVIFNTNNVPVSIMDTNSEYNVVIIVM